MYLILGDTTVDEGPDTLKLAEGSEKMPRDSYLNLDQRFIIEWDCLEELPWDVEVQVDPEELMKLDLKISQLDGQQNRCKLLTLLVQRNNLLNAALVIYKPLPTGFYNTAPGTVVML
jgi:hypothetical protein